MSQVINKEQQVIYMVLALLIFYLLYTVIAETWLRGERKSGRKLGREQCNTRTDWGKKKRRKKFKTSEH